MITMRTRLYFNSNGLEEKRKQTQHITEVYKKYLRVLHFFKQNNYNYTRTFKDFLSGLVSLKTTKFQKTHQCFLSYSSASSCIIFILTVIINLLKSVILSDWQRLRKLLLSYIKNVRKTITLTS